jgi:hypothetical protein
MKKNASALIHNAVATPLLTMYSLSTPPEMFDIRCEYEVPRYIDLNTIDDDEYDDEGSTGYPDWMQHPERKHSTTGGARPFSI